MKPRNVEVTVSNRTIARVILFTVGTFLALKFLSRITHPLELIFISVFLSLALNPAVRFISRHLKLKSRAAATGIAYVLVMSILVGFITLVVPPLVKQTVNFVKDAPATLNSLKTDNTVAGRFVQRHKLQSNIDGLSQNIKDHTKNLQRPAISTATRIGSALIAMITILVLTFMFLVEGPDWLRRYWQLHPKSRLEHDQELLRRMYRIVTGYVNGQVLIAAIAGLSSMTALVISSSIFHVSVNAVALGGIVFLFGLIPLIGNTLAAVLVATVCLFSSVGLAAVMLVYFLIYQQLENVTLQPYIQAKHNELTPLLVFAAALIGAGFGGLLGAFVAIPAAGCSKILFEDYLKTRQKS